MNFDESIKYLYSLGNEVLAMKLGLENPRKLLQALGNPHAKYLKVQVAGTNGKGSTCAFLDSICRSSNIKTGLFTSPHLISITERIKIDGQEISENDFAKYATIVREKTESERLCATFFEQMTAIALLAFAENGIDLAILETGMGGRLDATTAANAEIVGITPIDYDHQQYLGETLTEIAGEKAAIIRENTKAVVSPQAKEAEKVISGRCREVGVEPIWATTDITSKIYNDAYPIVSTSFKTENNNYPRIVLSLEGRHQITNASLAIGLAEILREHNLKITNENICLGLETAEHRGRLEYYEGILFDGSHNIAGAKALRDYLQEFVQQPITLIFGAMKDKDIGEIAEMLFPQVESIIFIKIENDRSLQTEELMKFLPADFNLQNVFQAKNIEEALKVASCFSRRGITCVTGSLYLVGEVQKSLDSSNTE